MSQESERKAWLAAMQEVLQEHARLLLTGQARVLELINQARGEILAILAAQPADWQQLHLGRVLEQIDAILSAATGKAAAAAADVLERAWELGQLMVDKPLIAIGAAAELLPLQNVRLLRAMQQFVAGRFADVDAVAHGKIDTALSLTLLGGQTPQEAMRQVADAIGPGSEVRARTIVRTEAGRAFASAHYERLLQSAKLYPQLHKVWRRSGKANSRDEHDIMDGVAVPVAAHFHVPNRKGGTDAMLHPKDPSAPVGQVVNCGCVLLSWDSRLGPPPGAKPFSARELERNPQKAGLDRLAKGLRQEPLPALPTYEAAKAGGAHSGFYKNARDNMGVNQLRAGIKSLQKQIDMHRGWIADPHSKPGVAHAKPEDIKLWQTKKWPGDIARQMQHMQILQGLLHDKERERKP